MAPIDPNHILKAFNLFVTENGGILNKEKVPQLSGVMKKYSKKLVSKCTYCNILLATEEKLLDDFLDCDGWDILNSWLKEAIENKSYAFLFDLIKVFDKCPITLERLTKNDTAEKLKLITKFENEDLAKFAKKVYFKWKAIYKKNKDISSATSEENKKRKISNDLKGTKSNENVNIKKLKAIEDVNNDKCNVNLGNKSNTSKTVKVKLGKQRSIGVLESENKLFISHKNTINKLEKTSSQLKNNTVSTPTLPLNKLIKSNNNDVGIKVIEPRPFPNSNLTNPSHNSKHIIKESAGFMNALSSNTVNTSKIKKKKKIEKATLNSSFSDLNQQLTKENNSNHMEDNEKSVDSTISENNFDVECSKEIELNLSNHQPKDLEFLSFTNIAFDPGKTPTRSILTLTSKSGQKKRISWPSDDKIEKVKYFEMDENERCNVYKLNFNEHRMEEISKERSLISKNNLRRIENRGIDLLPWKIIPIELDQIEMYRSGVNSIERKIQEERFKTVLPEIFLPGHKAESPQEPDHNELIQSNSFVENQPKLIPLEDENMPIAEFTSTAPDVSILSKNIIYSNQLEFINNNVLNNIPSLNNQPINTNCLNNNFLNTHPTHLLNNNNLNVGSNFLNTLDTLLPSMTDTIKNENLNYKSYQTTPNSSQIINNSWSNWTKNINDNLNSINNNTHQKNGNRSHRSQLCKFYARNGNCKYETKCTFLHQSPKISKLNSN